MVELDEPHSTLRKASRDQAIIGKACFADLRTVLCANGFGLFVNVHCIRRIHLHAEGHLILRNSRHSFRISECAVILLIQFIDRIEHTATLGGTYVGRAVQIQHWLTMGTALHALIDAGQKAAAPKLLPSIRRVPTGNQDNEAGQILILGAESVHYPGTQRRISQTRIACLDEQLRRSVIELVRAHRLDEAKIVEMLLKMRQAIGDPMAAVADLMKWILRSHQLGDASYEREPFPSQQGSWTILPVEPHQLRLVFEKLKLARCTGHVHIDHSLNAGRKLRRKDRERMLGIARQIEWLGISIRVIAGLS